MRHTGKLSYHALVLFVALLAIVPAGAQNWHSLQYLKPDNGLSHRNVFSILQDKQGYMWFGTENGLNRFDGNRFLVLNTKSPVCPLSGNEIRLLLQDKRGNLWIGTDDGLDLLDPVKLTVQHLSVNTPGNSEPESNAVSAIAEDADGTIWVGTRSGMLQKYKGNGKFATVRSFRTFSPPFENFFIQEISFDKQGNLWLSYRAGGVEKVNKEGKTLRQYKLPLTIMDGPFLTKSGELIALLDDGVYRYNAARDTFIRDMDPAIQSTARAWLEDTNGDQWLSLSYKKLLHFTGGKWQEETAVVDGLKETDALIQCLYEDRSHNLWVGTNYGIVKTPLRKREFSTYLSFSQFDRQGVRYSIRGMLEEADGSLWVGSYGHLHHIFPRTGEVKEIPTPTRFFAEPASLNPYVLIREGKYIWMATEGNGLVRFDPATNEFHFFDYFNYRKYLGAPRFLTSMMLDGSGRLWMGTYYGLYFKSAGKDSFYSYDNLLPGNELKKTTVVAIKQDAKGDVWLGTQLGLFCIDPGTLKIKRHYSSFGKSQAKPTVIEDIAFGRNGNIWLATKGEGLIRFNPSTGESKNWTVEEGLTDNVVYSILRNGENLWASTHNGLNYLNTRTSTFYHFYIEDGLPDNEFNHGAALQTREGDMYFGGINGISRFDPEKVSRVHGSQFPLVFTQIDRYDPQTGTLTPSYADLSKIKSIDLPYDNRYLNVYFALTDYSRPDKNQYRYILEGYDTKWHNLGNQNYISMLGIPSGKYLLRIRAIGSNGIPNPNELRLQIIAQEAFYTTWWFIALVLLLIGALATGFYFYRIRQYQKLIALRTQIASDLHDEVGSHLTRIAISSDLMKESPDNRIDALIDHIAQSSRQAVATMSDVIWSIDTRSDKVGSLLDRMREHARNIFEPAGISYSIEAKNLEESDRLHMDQRHDLYLIFKEATNNVVKHSNASQVIISLENRHGNLKMTVADNGTNAPNPNRTTGMGLRNMQMRAKRMNGNLQHAFKNGFTVEFTVNTHT